MAVVHGANAPLLGRMIQAKNEKKSNVQNFPQIIYSKFNLLERDVQGAHGDAGGDGEEDHSPGGGGAA